MVDGRTRRLSEGLLLKSGVRVLNTRALDGLRRVLSPDALEAASKAGDQATVSRHAAYRLWPVRDQAVVDIARHVLDPEELASKGVTSALKAYEAAIAGHVSRQRPAADLGKDQRREVFQQVLAANFGVQLGSDERLAAWLLQVAATTCSPLWKDTPDPGSADYELGRQILEARIRFNKTAIAEWAVLLRGAMALFGRRPRAGYTVPDIVQLMYCMFDGSFLRLFVDPEVVVLGESPTVHEPALQRAISRACDAMFEIAWSCTEPGLLSDPRRPDDLHDPRARTFDGIVQRAVAHYQRLKPGELVELHDIVTETGEDLDVAEHLFPEPGDLADSMLRHLVKEHDPGKWKVDNAAPWIESTLQVLSDTASSHPAVVAAAARHRPSHPSDATGFVSELIQAITGLLQVTSSLRNDDPAVEASHLVALALEGESGWRVAKAALDRAAAYVEEG